MTLQTIQPVYAPGRYQQQTSVQLATIRMCVSRRPQWLTSAGRQLVLLLRDASSSMRGNKAKEATAASCDLIDELANPVNKDGFHCGVIDFSSLAEVRHAPTKATELAGKVEPIDPGGSTNIHHALELALGLLRNPVVDGQESWHPPVVVLFSDGEVTEGGDPVPMANQVKNAGALIITVAYGDDADLKTLQAIASSPQHCYSRSTSSGELRRFMATVGRTLTMTMTTGQDPKRALGSL